MLVGTFLSFEVRICDILTPWAHDDLINHCSAWGPVGYFQYLLTMNSGKINMILHILAYHLGSVPRAEFSRTKGIYIFMVFDRFCQTACSQQLYQLSRRVACSNYVITIRTAQRRSSLA